MGKVTCTNCGADNKPINKYCTDCGYELPKIKMEEVTNSVQLPTKESKEMKKMFSTIIWYCFLFRRLFYSATIIFQTPIY